MMDLTGPAALSVGLGVLSLLGVGVSHLALTDIWHGEGDLVAEWWVLRISFLLIVLFHVAALSTLWRVLRIRNTHDPRH